MAFNALEYELYGRWKLTDNAEKSLPDTSPMCNDSPMCEPSGETISSQLTLFAGDSPVRISALLEAARDWLESEADFGSSSIAFLRSLGRDCALSKMSPAFYPATQEGTLPSSFKGWSNSGIASPGGYLTLNIFESPSDAVVCSLWEVLEPDALPKYSLSPKACAGILRRARKRGKELPETLRQALEAVSGISESEIQEDRTV